MKVTIDRTKWYRGKGSATSRLLIDADSPNHGKMCCLGFVCLALGASKKEICGKQMPFSEGISQVFPDWLTDQNGEDLYTLTRTNDCTNIEESERERAVIETCAKHDIEIEFIN